MTKLSDRVTPGIQPAALSVADFCAAHGISVSTFYSLPDEDRPVLIRLGGRVIITLRAAEEWRQQMEAKSVARVARGYEQGRRGRGQYRKRDIPAQQAAQPEVP